MNEPHNYGTTDSFVTPPGWVVRSGVDRRLQAAGRTGLPASGAGSEASQAERIIDSSSRESTCGTRSTAACRELDVEDMEARARVYFALADSYVRAGVQQLRALRRLKNLEAMRKFKSNSLALRTEIASKHSH